MAAGCPCGRKNKKSPLPAKAEGGESFFVTLWGKATHQRRTIRPTEYRCYIKEVNHQYATAGAVFPPQGFAFVYHTTPHHGSTSRGKTYSVRGYITGCDWKSKAPFDKFVSIVQICFSGYPIPRKRVPVSMQKRSGKFPAPNILDKLAFYEIGSKSAAPCLHSGHTISSGSSSPS